MPGSNKVRKITAFTLLAVFLFVMSYFTIFEGTRMIHDCTGDDCPICHELQIAGSFTKQITVTAAAAGGCFFYTVFLKNTETDLSGSESERNLIIDKVRIDD